MAAACALVVCFYVWKTQEHPPEFRHGAPNGAYYNLLVDGFRAGQLNLKIETPPGLAQLSDPWDPVANFAYRKGAYAQDRLHDASYYQGKLYLYFSATPALLLFWPYRVLTGGYLEHATAVAVFCSMGFLISAGLWRAGCRRYFKNLSPAVVAGGVLALGFANSVPLMLERPDVYEVPISCAFALLTAGLAALWRALHQPEHLPRWLAVSATLFGLAASARPTFAVVAPVVVLAFIASWPRIAITPGRRAVVVRSLIAIVLPLVLIGLALAWYNQARFGDPLEFGQRYQLAGDRQDNVRHFALSYIAYNFRLYFLSPAPWTAAFPFFREVTVPPLPAGHGDVDSPFGILINTPATMAVVLLPLAWGMWRRAGHSALRWFIGATTLVFAAKALLLCAFYGTTERYQVEFNPRLVLLAVFAAGACLNEWSGQFPRRACALAWVGVVALGYSAAFSVLAGFEKTSDRLNSQGVALYAEGDLAGALQRFEQSHRFAPSYVTGWFNGGMVHQRLGEHAKAVESFEGALRAGPRSAETLEALTRSLRALGRLDEARQTYAEARGLRPELPPPPF